MMMQSSPAYITLLNHKIKALLFHYDDIIYGRLNICRHKPFIGLVDIYDNFNGNDLFWACAGPLETRYRVVHRSGQSNTLQLCEVAEGLV